MPKLTQRDNTYIYEKALDVNATKAYQSRFRNYWIVARQSSIEAEAAATVIRCGYRRLF